MKEHSATIKDELQENNNSFIFLEKSSLNLLLAYLLTNKKNETPESRHEVFDSISLKKLDQMIRDNEKEFKEIITLLKKVT